MRKLMIICKALHLKNEVDRLYVTRKVGGGGGGGGGLISIEENVEMPTQRLKEYINKCKERLISAANISRNNKKKRADRKNKNW